MSTLRFLLQKEFRQIFRDKSLLPLIFFMPIVQLLILPLAADYEVKNINVTIVDQDHSTYSQKLVSKIGASGYFRLTGYVAGVKEAFNDMESDRADLILEIPQGFERNLVRENRQSLFLAVNAINGVKANLGSAYLSRIIADYNGDIRLEWIDMPKFSPSPRIEITQSDWFNPSMNYRFYMVPGILALLVTMIGAYLCALNIVREKEVGTIEQINVTPIQKYQFLLGKLIPFWIIGMIIFTVGLFGIAWPVYGIIPAGNLLLLYGYLAVYLVAILGLGLLISTYAETQQQAMSIAFFFMIIFILMSGLFTPIDSMPRWAHIIARSSPVTYFIEVMRMIVLKGSGFEHIWRHFLIMMGFAIGFNAWAIVNYRKTN